jgi:hypothetical protein
MKIIITETFLHYLPNGLGWIEGLEQLGHEVYALQSHVNKITDIDEYVDIVVFMGMHTVILSDIIEFKNKWPDTKLVAVCFGFDESYLQLKKYIDLWVEHNYKHDLVDKLFKEADMKLVHIPLATSINKFNKIDIPKIYDTSFIGQFGNTGHGYREQDYYLDPIINLKVKGFYSGFYNYPNINVNELNRIYNSTKINLNFHYPNQKIQSDQQTDSIDFNSRIFDIAISNNFQLCDHPNIHHIFEDGIEHTSKEDWLDKFYYYLHNESDRLEMADKAYKICSIKHTWKARMVDFLEHMNISII